MVKTTTKNNPTGLGSAWFHPVTLQLIKENKIAKDTESPDFYCYIMLNQDTEGPQTLRAVSHLFFIYNMRGTPG